MTTIGTAVLQIIPSLDGVSKAVDKQLGGLSGMGKKAGQQLGKGIGDGLKEAGDAYSKFKDKADDALGKVRKEEAALQDLRDKGTTSGARFVAAEERLATARRNSTRATREAEDSHNTLLSAQKRLGDGADDTGGKFSRLSGIAGTLGSAVATAGVAAGAAAIGGIALLAAGAVKATSELYQLGAQFDDMSDNLRLKTGATGDALKGLEGSVTDIAAKVPLSIGAIGDVVAETSRAFKGLDPSQFENLVGHVADLGRLTGEQVDVRNLGKAFRIMGVDVKDQVPTLDAFFRANESSGIGVNELIGIVNRGGAQLKQFGLGMAQSAALVGGFEEAGVDASKVIPGLNTALKNFAKAGTDPRKGLEDTITQVKALSDAGNDTGALDLANKIFGAKGGVAFKEVIASGNLDLQTLTDSLSSTGDTIDKAAADTDDWAESWQKFKNQAETALKPFATATFDGINTALEDLAAWVTTHQPEIIDGIVKIGTAFIDMAHIVLKGAGQAIEGFGQLVGGIGNVYGAILKADSGLQRLVGNEDYANQLLADAEAAYGWGEGLEKLGQNMQTAAGQTDGWKAALQRAGDTAKDALAETDGLNKSIWNLAGVKASPTIDVKINAIPGTGAVTNATGGISIPVDTINVGGQPRNTYGGDFGAPPPPGGTPHRAKGGLAGRTGDGRLWGPGTGTSDSILGVNGAGVPTAYVSDGEGIVKKSAMDRGGARIVAALNRYDTGGIIPQGSVSIDPNLVGGGLYRNKRILWWGGDDGLPRGANPGDPLIPWGPNAKGKMVAPNIFGGLPGEWPPDNNFPRQGDSRDIWRDNRNGVGGFAGGGVVGGPDVDAAMQLVGTPYSQGNRTDCSGMAARVIARALGLPESGLMTTKNASKWLTAAGFQKGTGGLGQISVGWYDHGPGPNDGHMALTLSDGTHAEAGGKNGVFTLGAAAAGADSPQFDQHMFLPTLFGEGRSGSFAGSGSSSSGGGGTAGIGPNGESGTYSAPDAKTVREANEKVADADARVRQAELKQKELKADAKDSEKQSAQAEVEKATREAADARADAQEAKKGTFTPGSGSSSGGSASISLPSAFSGLAGIGLSGLGLKTKASPNSPERTFEFGNAAAEAVGGQIGSLLGVAGIPDSPPFLQAASKLIGGISIGDGPGSSAAPVSAAFSGTGTPPPDDVHGSRAGQPPGPVFNTTIQARDSEDAVNQWRRWQNERVAAKTSAY